MTKNHVMFAALEGRASDPQVSRDGAKTNIDTRQINNRDQGLKNALRLKLQKQPWYGRSKTFKKSSSVVMTSIKTCVLASKQNVLAVQTL